METKKSENIVKLPVCLGYTREEMIETYPRLSSDKIDEILNAAYDLQVGFDLAAGKFVSVETVTYYKKPESAH